MASVSVLVLLRARSLVQLDRFLPVLLNNSRKQSIRNLSISRHCSTSDNAIIETKNSSDNAVSEKPKKKEETKITLLLPDNSLMVTDLENANKIAKRRGLMLIKVEKVQKKTDRPVYKLMHQTEHIQQELEDDKNEKENAIKSIKTIQISSKITLHDLHIKLKNVNKLLDKNHKVKIVLVHGSNMQDNIIKNIETSVKNHGTVQKTTKLSSTIFAITPVSNTSNNTNLNNVDENKKR